MVEKIIPRKSHDGIIFYVSANGNTTGISIAGLERLLGLEAGRSRLFVPERNKLLFDMSIGVQRENIPKSLEPAWGRVFDSSGQGIDGAKIITEEAAVCIIEHYAFEQKNETAQESFRRFAKKGFSTWVKELVNFSTNPATSQDILLVTMQQLLAEVQTLTAKVSKWDKIEGITATVYPGMKMLNDGISSIDAKKILDSGELYTACEWLAIKGIVVDKSTKHAFVRQASDTYKTMTGERPPKKYKPSQRKDGSVKWVLEGNGYRIVDFHILEAAWDTYQEQPKGKNAA